MASPSPKRTSQPRPTGLRGLVGLDMLWVAWLPVLIIGSFHYATHAHAHWIHDVLRRLYYLPILFAAFSRGIRGGLAVSLVASLTYAPHAFLLPDHMDPGTTPNKLLEIVLYNVVGVLAGLLADREAARRAEVERALADERRMADQLIRAGRLAALGELVAGVAHEIKNPLHTIKGTAEIVDDVVPKDAPQAEMWKLLRQEVDRLERIAERFLSFARPNEPHLEPHEFGAVYKRVGELLAAHTVREDHVTLAIAELPFSLSGRRVRVDRDQIAQIVLNIASNAMVAMEQNGTLQVRAGHREHDDRTWITLEMENDGPAIPEDKHERIFDPFHTGTEEGTGLGLAISGRIAQAHGGFLDVENTGEERGVVFTLNLPATDDA